MTQLLGNCKFTFYSEKLTYIKKSNTFGWVVRPMAVDTVQCPKTRGSCSVVKEQLDHTIPLCSLT